MSNGFSTLSKFTAIIVDNVNLAKYRLITVKTKSTENTLLVKELGNDGNVVSLSDIDSADSDNQDIEEIKSNTSDLSWSSADEIDLSEAILVDGDEEEKLFDIEDEEDDTEEDETEIPGNIISNSYEDDYELDLNDLNEMDIDIDDIFSDDTQDLEDFSDRDSLVSAIIDPVKKKEVQKSNNKNIYGNFQIVYVYKKEEFNTNKLDPAEKNLLSVKLQTYGDRETYTRISNAVQSIFNSSGSKKFQENEMLNFNGRIVPTRSTKTVDTKGTQRITMEEVPFGNILMYKLVSSEYLVDLEPKKSGKQLTNLMNGIIDGSGLELNVDVYSRLTKDELMTLRKDNLSVVNFPPIEYFKSFLNLDYLDETDYKILDTEDKIIKYFVEPVSKLPKDHVIAYDAETTGLRFRRWLEGTPNADELVTHSFSWADNQAVIIPVRMKTCQNVSIDIVNKYIKPVMETRRILAHNGLADTLFNMYDHIDLNLCEDTMIMIKHIVPYLSKNGKVTYTSLNRSLKRLLDRAFNEDKIDLNKYVFNPLGMSFDFSILPKEYLIAYGCPDTDRLRKLWKLLYPKLDETQKSAYYEMVKFSKIMTLMSEWNGLRLSNDLFKVERDKQKELFDLLTRLIYQITGENEETLQLSSSQKVANYIYTRLGVPITKDTKKTVDNKVSADKEVLKRLADIKLEKPSNAFKEDIMDTDGITPLITKEQLNSCKYPFCLLMVKWRDIYKNITSYFDALINKSIDGIYYPAYRIGGADTWRTLEGIQTTKGDLKYGMVPYSDDWGVFCLDFSSQELRIASNLGRDPEMGKILSSPEADAHRAVAAQAFGIKPYQVTYAQRKKGKTTNFGIIYGIGVAGLAKNLNGTSTLTPQMMEEARKIHTMFNATYRQMTRKLKTYTEHASKFGWVQNELGFRMIYPHFLNIKEFEKNVFDPNQNYPPEIVIDEDKRQTIGYKVATAAGNYPVQSYAASLLMMLVNKVYEEFNRRGYAGKFSIPIVVHDELNIFYHKSISPFEVLDIAKSICEVHYEDPAKVPLYIGTGFGHSWGEAKSDLAELPVGLQNELVEEFRNGTYDKSIDVHNAPEYFLERRKEYIRNRIKNAIPFVTRDMVYNTAEVIKTLREDAFLLSQGADLFKIFHAKTGAYNHENIIKVLVHGTDIDPKKIKFVEEEIVEDKTSDIVSFIFQDYLHPRINMTQNSLIITADGLKKETIDALLKYLFLYNSTPYGDKDVRFRIGNKVLNPIPDLKLSGLPANANISIDAIIKGKTLNTNNLPVDVDKLVVTKGNYVIINLYMLDRVEDRKKIQELIAKSFNTKDKNQLELLICDDKSNPTKAMRKGIYLDNEIIIEKLKNTIRGC